MLLRSYLKPICPARLSRIITVVLVSLVLLIIYHFSSHQVPTLPHIKLYDIRDIMQVDNKFSFINGLANDDPKLIDIVRKHWIEPPSNEPYNFSNPSLMKTSMFGQDTFIDGLLNQMEHGFFIEAGAVDGEAASNSLFFETSRKWTGLLVEPDPIAYGLLKTKHRKAYTVNSCLDSHPSQVVFDVMWRHGHIEMENETTLVHDFPHHKRRIQCFSIYSLLLAINQTRVDYFSLDIENAEPQVLKAIPFDKIDIRVICVEFIHCGKQKLYDILIPHGYKMVKEMEYDLIFIKL